INRHTNWDNISATIVEPDVESPGDLDDEMDGEWEAPKFRNAEYKQNPQPCAWGAPRNRQPRVQGCQQNYTLKNAQVGFDLRQVKPESPVIVTDSVDVANGFGLKAAEKESKAQQKEKKEAEE
ncbi:hypothetical protein HDU81_008474, partial [Chytriomyces hyalinus]